MAWPRLWIAAAHNLYPLVTFTLGNEEYAVHSKARRQADNLTRMDMLFGRTETIAMIEAQTKALE